MTAPNDQSKLIDTAAVVGRDWVAGQYYDDAEKMMDQQWNELIWPLIQNSDFSTVMELAPGHGRNTAKLLKGANKIYAVDINASNIEVLNKRFAGEPRVVPMQNSGADVRMLDGASVTFVYCFDAMVHFDSDVVRAYIREFRRIMKPGARGFVHYSANDKNPNGTYRDHPGWRNFMSQPLFEHWLTKEGFKVLASKYASITYGFDDSVTYFELPATAEPYGSFAVHNDAGPKTVPLLRAEVTKLKSALQAQSQRLNAAQDKCRAYQRSTSWRITAPMRKIARLIKRK